MSTLASPEWGYVVVDDDLGLHGPYEWKDEAIRAAANLSNADEDCIWQLRLPHDG